jgi:phospholipid/cholesterol/gamma-HCH transport system substrate-binding protein
MDLHYQKEVAVGTLVLAGIGLFVGGTLWLKGTSFHPRGRTAVIQFADLNGLQPDNAVTVSGYQVGKVAKVDFKEPGRVLVTVTLPPDLPLKADASAEVVTSLFASGARLNLMPGSPGAPDLPEGKIILGAQSADLFAKGSLLADRADSVLIGVQAIANQKTADELVKTLQAMQRTLNTMNERLPSTTREAERTMIAFRKLSEKLDSTVSALPVGNAIERADTLAKNLSTMSLQLTATGARIDTLLQRINSGQGTLGKFATDSGLYNDSRAALQSMKLLIDDLSKHPGKLSVQVKLF